MSHRHITRVEHSVQQQLRTSGLNWIDNTSAGGGGRSGKLANFSLALVKADSFFSIFKLKLCLIILPALPISDQRLAPLFSCMLLAPRAFDRVLAQLVKRLHSLSDFSVMSSGFVLLVI